MTHALIGTLRREGHWLLTDADAKAYGQAVKNVARHYPIGVTQKGLDLYALAMCMINVEGSRVVASYRNTRRRRDPPPQPAPTATVYPFPSNPQQPPPTSTAAAAPNGNGGAVEGFTGDGIDAPLGGH
jgi:hypothetical protein